MSPCKPVVHSDSSWRRLYYPLVEILSLPVLRIRSDPVFLGHPDPDPGKYRIRILYLQKEPMLFKFSRYKIV